MGGESAKALLGVANVLKNLDVQIRQLNEQMTALFELATDAMHQFFQTLGSNNLQAEIKKEVKRKFVNKAFDRLDDNDLYRTIPRELRDGFKDIVRSAIKRADK